MIANGDPENHLDIIQLLIDRGVDLDLFDDNGRTALIEGIFEDSSFKKLTLI